MQKKYVVTFKQIPLKVRGGEVASSIYAKFQEFFSKKLTYTIWNIYNFGKAIGIKIYVPSYNTTIRCPP